MCDRWLPQAGLRAGEVVGLKVTDIDSQRTVLRIQPHRGSRQARLDAFAEALCLAPDYKEVRSVVFPRKFGPPGCSAHHE